MALFIVLMSNALAKMMAPRPSTPEHLRLTVTVTERGRRRAAMVHAQHLAASTTEALKFMYRSVQEKGHALQIVDSRLPCWVRKAATT